MNQYFEPGERILWTKDPEPDSDSMTVPLQFLKEYQRSGNKQVMVAKDARTEEEYFVKILFCEEAEQIYVEKESKVQLYSPFIVRIYGGMLLEERSCFITLMEFIPHQDLSTLIRKHQIQAETTTAYLSICHKIALKILYGIDYYMSLYVTDPIVHRDLKPENIMASADGSVVKIIDFDWVHLHDSSVTIMQRREQKGTPGYADPASWNSYICKKSMDIYSAGLVLYFLYTGQHHFYGNAELQRYLSDPVYASTLKPMPGIDMELVSIIAKMIAPEESRYQNIKDVIADFKAYLASIGVVISLPELLGPVEEEDTIRLTYRVGDVKYSPYLQKNRFVMIDYGRKQERSQNGKISDTIMGFYRFENQIRYIVFNEQCRKIRVADEQLLQEGDLFFYGNTEIEIQQILIKKR